MKRTITKVLAELRQEKPDLSYIRGLLEGLVDEDPGTTTYSTSLSLPSVSLIDNSHVDEEIIPEVAKTGPIAPLS